MDATPIDRLLKPFRISQPKIDEPRAPSVPWQNPEDSIGTWYRTLGKSNCWEARGPARRLFLQLADEIKHHLEAHGDAVAATVIWSAYMVGRCKSRANPTVFFCSPSADARKKVRKEIEHSGILSRYAGFATADSNRPPHLAKIQQLAAKNQRSSTSCRINPCGNPIGTPIRVKTTGPEGSSILIATVGAVLEMDDVLFFSTAAHVFAQQHAAWEFDNDDDSDFECDLNENDDDDLELSSSDQEQQDHENTQPVIIGHEVQKEHPVFDEPEVSSSEDELVYDTQDVSFSSLDGPNRGLDYALVVLDKNDPRIFRGSPAAGRSCSFHVVNPRDVVKETPIGGTVVAYTGSRNATAGMLLGMPSFLTSSDGRLSQELWSVQLEGTLVNGDCGSIIVSENTGALLGHIVAGSPETGTALIVPAYQIFEDLQKRFGKNFKLSNIFENCQLKECGSTGDAGMAKSLTEQFRKLLSEKRMKSLSEWRSSKGPMLSNAGGGMQLTNNPPDERSHSSYTSLILGVPRIPKPPRDARALRFRNMLHSFSNMPLTWENPGRLDEALRVLPLDKIYTEAHEEFEIFVAEAKSLAGGKKPAWGYQDCVCRALLRFFKRSFFSWVNHPICDHCGSPTVAVGMAAPLSDEKARGAHQVELYRCASDQCGSYERFPRYNDAFVLLETRKGRVGEWSNCFSMLSRALGLRVRWVWNSEDQVWTEVYSQHRKRWVHVDACEEAWDKPRLYTDVWGKKLAYCIAFSAEGAMDVTRRYVRSARYALERTRAAEAELLYILDELRAMRRGELSKQDRIRLKKEDLAEEKELRRAVAIQVAYELCKLDPAAIIRGPIAEEIPNTDAEKFFEEERLGGSIEWADVE